MRLSDQVRALAEAGRVASMDALAHIADASAEAQEESRQ